MNRIVARINYIWFNWKFDPGISTFLCPKIEICHVLYWYVWSFSVNVIWGSFGALVSKWHVTRIQVWVEKSVVKFGSRWQRKTCILATFDFSVFKVIWGFDLAVNQMNIINLHLANLQLSLHQHVHYAWNVTGCKCRRLRITCGLTMSRASC